MTKRSGRTFFVSAFGAALACAAAILGGAASAAEPAAAPLLAWGDDPPAVEVRALSGDRTLAVRYGALDPKTFFVKLDGELVTGLFAPVAGGAERVELPFIGGRNRVEIGASSVDGLVHVVLEREIVFARRPEDAAAPAGARLHSAPELKHELWIKRTPEAAPPASAPTSAPPSAPPAAAPPTR